MSKQKNAKLVLLLCALAGLFYNSWPLGYLLNNPTAHGGLASDLEVVGHPYFWIFILGDVLTGLSLIIVFLTFRIKLWPKLNTKALKFTLLGLLIFGAFTIISALLPSECSVTPILRCGADQGRGLGLDALTSAIAAIGLLVSLISVNSYARSNKSHHLVQIFTTLSLLIWSFAGLLFIVFAVSSGNAHLTQQIYLILSGLSLLLVGLNLNIVANNSKEIS